VETGDTDAVTALGLAAAIEASRGEYECAARILGAEEAGCERVGLPFYEGAESVLRQETIDLIRSRLDASLFEEAWAHGRALELDEALAYALGTLEKA
jgi:hypothetical protein